MARLLNITAGLIYVLWLVLGTSYPSGNAATPQKSARAVLAGTVR